MKQMTSITGLAATLLLCPSPARAAPCAGAAPGEAAQFEKVPKAEYLVATLGLEARLADEAGEELGTIQDHVIERVGGRVRFVVVDPTGEGRGLLRLVPWSALLWDSEQTRLALAWSAEELAEAPAFDPAALQGLGLDSSVSGASGASGVDGGQAEGEVGLVAAGHEKSELRNVLATKLVGAPVSGKDAPLGQVGELVLEPRAGRVAFVMVRKDSAREGTEATERAREPALVVPWQALLLSEKGRLVVPLNAEALEEAPRLAQDELRGAAARRALEEVYRFYKIPPPVHPGTHSGKHSGLHSEGKGTMGQG